VGITIRGVHLGHIGLDYELLVFPHPNYILHTQRQEAAHTWYKCPVIAYIIDHPDGRILWETGISDQWPQEWTPEWQFLIDLNEITPEVCLEGRLKELKLGPDDFRYVMMGHLHLDHAGGLRLFQDAGSEIVVHENEYRAVENLQGPENFFQPVDYAFLKGKAPTLVSGDQEFMRDVKLVELPGHTPGTMGVLVKLDHTGWVLLTSDAMYTHDSYGPPATGSPIVWDAGKWGQSLEKIRQLAMTNEALLFPGHDETGIKQYAGKSDFQKIEFWPNYVYE
jgi:N-acyl homoserine lactone hydrolase